jgi:WD40 repeat protein
MESEAISLSVSPDGTLLALSGASSVRLWEIRQARLRHLLTAPYSTTVYRSAFSPDGRLLVGATNGSGVRLWETQGGLLLHTFPMSDPVNPGAPAYTYVGTAYEVAFAPDGSHIAAAGDNKIYRIWNMKTFALERTLTTPGNPTRSLAFTPDGRFLATGDMVQEQQTRSNAIRFWDLSTGQVRNVLNDPRDTDHNGRFLPPHVQPVPKKPLLASWAFNDTLVMLWNLPAGPVAKQLPTGPEGLTGLTVSADGSQLAVTLNQGSISVWDIATAKKIRQWRGHDGRAVEPAFAPDGKTLATTGLDRTVKFWSVPDGKLRTGRPHCQRLDLYHAGRLLYGLRGSRIADPLARKRATLSCLPLPAGI